MKQFFSRIPSVVLLLCLAGIESGVCQLGAADAPFFEKRRIHSSDGGDFAINAYPVIAPLPNGDLFCVWTAGRKGDQESYRIVGAFSKDQGKSWTSPVLLIQNENALDADPNILIDGQRILIFSTTIPLPSKIERSQIWMRSSEDMGQSWSQPVQVTMPHRYVAGKIHIGHKLADGTLIMGYAYDTWAEQGMVPATEGEMDIKSGVLRSKDGGKTWTAGGDLYASIPKTSPHAVSGVDEPATVVLKDGRIFVLLRTAGTQFYQSFSSDGGLTWRKPSQSPLVAHNAPAALCRLKEPDQEVVVVWDNSPQARTPLCVALSKDNCRSWSAPKILASPQGVQASYPSVAQAADGTLIAVWQEDLPDKRGREIHLARFNRSWLLSKNP